MLRRRVLLIDNDMAFRETGAAPLRDHGYEVLEAASLEQARQVLDRRWVELMLVDIRLVDDHDPEDLCGLWLVHEGAYPGVVKVVLSVYSRAALEQRAPGVLAEVGPEVTFLQKGESGDELAAHVRRLFTERLNTNHELIVRVPECGPTLSDIARVVAPHDDDDVAAERVSELEYLLQRVFVADEVLDIMYVQQNVPGVVLVDCVVNRDGRSTQRRLLVGPQTGSAVSSATVDTLHYRAWTTEGA